MRLGLAGAGLVVFAAFAACDAGSEEDDGTEQTGMDIQVVESQQQLSLGVVDAPPGSAFVLVYVNLRNDTDDSLGIAAPLFRLKSVTGVEYSGDPVTDLMENGCRKDASLSPGGTTSCWVAFSAPVDVITESVGYLFADGTMSTAPLSCDYCYGQCATPGEACGVGSVASCEDFCAAAAGLDSALGCEAFGGSTCVPNCQGLTCHPLLFDTAECVFAQPVSDFRCGSTLPFLYEGTACAQSVQNWADCELGL